MTDDKKERTPHRPSEEKIEKRDPLHRQDSVRPSKEIAKDHKVHEATDWDRPPPPPKKK
jgi:hypothetical protein